jgi:hypothetical protein
VCNVNCCDLHYKVFDSHLMQVLVNNKTASASEIVSGPPSYLKLLLILHMCSIVKGGLIAGCFFAAR